MIYQTIHNTDLSDDISDLLITSAGLVLDLIDEKVTNLNSLTITQEYRTLEGLVVKRNNLTNEFNALFVRADSITTKIVAEFDVVSL